MVRMMQTSKEGQEHIPIYQIGFKLDNSPPPGLDLDLRGKCLAALSEGCDSYGDRVRGAGRA